MDTRDRKAIDILGRKEDSGGKCHQQSEDCSYLKFMACLFLEFSINTFGWWLAMNN